MSAALLRVRVARKQAQARDIQSFELVSVDGTMLPSFTAGSHIDVHLPERVIRQYSLCNDPAERHRYLIGVLKDPASRGGSVAMHERIREGDVLQISVPRNHFPLVPSARKSLLFAGGIGVTPLLCMAERLAAEGAEFEMHYCAKSREHAAFVDRIGASSFAGNVRYHFDDARGGSTLDRQALLSRPDEGTHVYVCGPKGFMEAILGAARVAGWAEDRLHSEFFSAEVAKTDADKAFEVMLASSGRIIVVPKDKTPLQALTDAGVMLPSACEQGVCGTCLTRVVEGTPEHRDTYLTDEEKAANDQFMPCCSRSKSARLVIDL